MRTEFFIAKRILKGEFEKRISKPIVNLATVGIALGVAVMILSISIAVGFQTEIRDKVLGFGGHIQITKDFNNDSQESSKMEVNQYWLADLMQEPNVKNVQQIAYKPGIIQSKGGIDTTSSGDLIRDMSGMVFKGIGKDFDTDFLSENILSGKIPCYDQKGITNDSILLSKYTTNQLKLKLGDKVACFFVADEGPKQKNLIVGGIYETGLEDFDKQFSYVDIAQIRKINKWGIETYISIEEKCTNGFVILRAETYGGNGNYYYSWNDASYSDAGRYPLCLDQDTTIIKLTSSDYETSSYLGDGNIASIPDTAWLAITKLKGKDKCNCTNTSSSLSLNYVSMDSTIFKVDSSTYLAVLKTSGGTHDYYCGGYEVIMNNFESLKEGKKTATFYTDNILNVQSITERHEEIFNWLGMLDLNVYIILSLMILVAVINMTSALLVIILERTRMIGILKALGSSNWFIRKIFLLNGGFIILRGLLFGTGFALLIIFIQNTTGFLTLTQSNYYVSKVPMYFVWWQIIAVNLGAYIICNLAMILPSYIITKISPVKSIKFE